MNLKSTILISLLIILTVSNVNAQIKTSTTGANTISTAVPFLTICADARSTSLGWSGAATSPDIYSQNQNPAKYAFYKPRKNLLSDWNYKLLYKLDTCKKDSNLKVFTKNIIDNKNRPDFQCQDSTILNDNFNFALSTTPWLRSLAPGMNLAYLVGNIRLDKFQSITGSLRYLNWEDIQFMSEYGDQLGQQKPNEFAVDLSYSRLLTENFSGAIAFRYIRSDIYGGQMVNGVVTHAGQSIAADLAFYYFKKFTKGMNNKVFSTGLYISNIGSKISYTDGVTKDFIPTNMKLGIAYSTEVDRQNSFTFTLDINKLLVPTPRKDSIDILLGSGSNKSPIAGILSSFSDAPGGLSEEIREVQISCGIEYAYQQNYFLRAGYFNENKYKGNRKFFTTGIGANLILNKEIFTIDAAYLITRINDPLGNIMQLSISFII